jgi:hypothetical protein
VMRGYKAMLGTGLLHLPMMAGTLMYVEVPIGLGGAIDQNIKRVYTLQVLIHVLVSCLFLMELNLKLWKRMEVWLEVGSIIVLIFSFFLFMYMFATLSLLADTSVLGPIVERPALFIKF